MCWYPFESEANVLDLSGGVLTEMLEERCLRAVSGATVPTSSCTRSGAGEIFDYVVVLDPEDFSVDSLCELRGLLGQHGRLLLAYENPFALRYWSGKPCPVTGKPFDSLFGQGGRQSAAELRIRIELAGFGGQKWYYPLSDHWFAQEIYSEDYLPDEYMGQRHFPYIADFDTLMFDERGLYREVIRGGAFPFMCGAYLVEARVCKQDKPCAVDYAAVTAYREPKHRFATTVQSDGLVHKTPLHPSGQATIRRIYDNHMELMGLGLNVVPVTLKNDLLVMPRITFPTLWDYWVAKLVAGKLCKDEVTKHFDRIREDINKASAGGKCFWELVPANCFFDEEKDEIIYFDQEYWSLDAKEVAMARALLGLLYSPALSADPRIGDWLEDFKARYGLATQWDELKMLAHQKTHSVFGDGELPLKTETMRATKRLEGRDG